MRGWIFALGVVLAAYVWAWQAVAPKERRAAADYYGFLTDALVSGQFSLKVPPDPRLAKLENPWKEYQGIPRLHDATYFHGRYYLYFGVTPVLVLLAPWRLLTGTFLSEGAAAVLFGFIGFLAGLDLLRRLVGALPRPPPPASLAAGVVVWGLGTSTFDLIQFPIFYSVPILAAHACLLLALAAVARALESPEAGRAVRWLAGASLAWGLSVGARPHYILTLPLLGLALVFLLARDRGVGPRNRAILVAAAVLPAAAVGAFLAWYNFSRFGTPFEFGFRYQFTSSDQRFIKIWSPAFFGSNLRAYLFASGLYSLYFPFFISGGLGIMGVVAVLPFSALAAVFPFTLLDPRLRRHPAWVAAGLGAFLSGCILLAGLCILPIGTYRYIVDYAPLFVLVALAAGAWLLVVCPRPIRAWIGLAGGLLAAASVVISVLLALQFSADGKTRHAAALFFDREAALVEKAAGLRSGPVRLTLSLDALKAGERAPLVETGSGTDFLYVERAGPRRVRFVFVHLGDPALRGEPVPVEPGRPHTIVADLGSLYPPDEHPALAGWPEPLRDRLHHTVRVTLDGRPVLDGSSDFFASDSLHVHVGRDLGMGLLPRYPGSIYSVGRDGLPALEAVEKSGWRGPVRLRLKFPPFAHFIDEPLVATGRRGAGDLIYVSYQGPGRLRFGHVATGGGVIETADLSYDPNAEHTLDVDLASLKAPWGVRPSVRRSVQLRFDGRWVMSADRAVYSSEPFEVAFGFDSLVTGLTQEAFGGPLLKPEPMPPLPPPADPGVGSGPLEITVQFPPLLPGVREPLAVTGKAGAGDFVYAVYDPPSHIRFAVDHWGVGGVVGDPVEITPGQAYVITIASAALAPGPASQIRVEMDGRTVLEAPFAAYPAGPKEIFAGRNPIGGSTCGPAFTGRVLAVRRLGPSH